MSEQPARIVTIVIVLAALLFGILVFSRRTPNPVAVVVPPTSEQPTTTPEIPEIPTDTPRVVRPKPDGMICDAGNAICLSASYTDVLLDNPITVTGTAIAFENQFNWQLEDVNGSILEEGTAMAYAPDAGQPGPFTIRQFFTTTTLPTTGFLVLFDRSAKDGAPINTVRVPVRLPTQTMTVNVYLPTVNSANADCKTVAPVKRTILKTAAVAEAALRELTRITSTDTVNGMKTSLSDGTELVSLVVNSGNAKAAFNEFLDQNVGGSCRVTSIRSQIERTLTQYPTIKTVEISTQTKSADEALQP